MCGNRGSHTSAIARRGCCDCFDEQARCVQTCVASAVQPRTSHRRGQRCACQRSALCCLSISASSRSTAASCRSAASVSVGNSCTGGSTWTDSTRQHDMPGQTCTALQGCCNECNGRVGLLPSVASVWVLGCGLQCCVGVVWPSPCRPAPTPPVGAGTPCR